MFKRFAIYTFFTVVAGTANAQVSPALAAPMAVSAGVAAGTEAATPFLPSIAKDVASMNGPAGAAEAVAAINTASIVAAVTTETLRSIVQAINAPIIAGASGASK